MPSPFSPPLAQVWLLACSLAASPWPPALRAAEFAIPAPQPELSFPRDHGSHPRFKLEWWYVTGRLEAEGGRRYGFQATFFRQAVPDPASTNVGGSGQIFLAHAAWLTESSGVFRHQAKVAREGWDAGSATNRLDVWNGNWSLRADPGAPEVMRLRCSVRAEVQFELRLTPTKPLVRFGEAGYARKAAEATAASYYLSYPRLAAEGEVVLDAQRTPARGEAWMDHEISSGQLGQGQVGWDWTCIQFNDGRELMGYRMRRADGSTDPVSTCTWVDREGRTTMVHAGQFEWTPAAWWTSPRSRARYPNTVRLSVSDPSRPPGASPTALYLEPVAADQEVADPISGIAYWEGACRVRNAAGLVLGKAYLELTGYAGSLGPRLR